MCPVIETLRVFRVFRVFRVLCWSLLLLAGCSQQDDSHQDDEVASDEVDRVAEMSPRGVTDPKDVPFKLSADLSGALLFWFDEQGVHRASSIEDIPPAARGLVRVRPLDPEVESQLDPLLVYVADLQKAPERGSYALRAMARSDFDMRVDKAAGIDLNPATGAPVGPVPPITVYRTAWCGVCKQAVAWLKEQGYPFVEKDVEKDAAAAQEVQQKLAAAGKTSRGVPVIDVGGKLMVGFDPNEMRRLLALR